MKRDDGALYALAMLMVLLLAMAAATAPAVSDNTELEKQETQQQEELVLSETMKEETPEILQQEKVESETQPEEKEDTKPEEQELSPEEIWQQEIEYLLGHIYGQITYDFYGATKAKHDLISNDIPEYIYQEYIKATEKLLQEAMENYEISDETIEQYNAAVANISDDDYRKLSKESIVSMQGFQEAIEYYSYMEAIRDLFLHKDITEEQYKAYYEKASYHENDGSSKEEDITHETIIKRIEYSKQFLTKQSKENIPIPYFS